jgi:hypothetical protein
MAARLKPVRTYGFLDQAYDHFNQALFAGKLPPCLITMQRRKGSYGYFSAERFAPLEATKGVTDEIALNPAQFQGRTQRWILSVLVHEMTRLWQHHFGDPSRGRYGNKEWAEKMKEIGLTPSDTGEPGGKETGQRVLHVIEQNGRFSEACVAFLKEHRSALYYDREGDEQAEQARRKKAQSKTKYTCPGCGLNAWAKPGANLWCGDCQKQMESEELAEAPAETTVRVTVVTVPTPTVAVGDQLAHRQLPGPAKKDEQQLVEDPPKRPRGRPPGPGMKSAKRKPG